MDFVALLFYVKISRRNQSNENREHYLLHTMTSERDNSRQFIHFKYSLLL